MTSKSHAQKSAQSSSDVDSPEKEALFAYMTSTEYRLRCEGEPDKAQVSDYIHLPERLSQRDILEQEIKNANLSKSAEYLRIIEDSTRIHRTVVWETRRRLVEGMNRASLESLAKHYDISPGSECIRDHPNANDLDKGLLLARMRQFLWWDGEYHGIAPEMYSIDCEAAKNSAESRQGKSLPPDNEPFESVLRYASTCKKASDGLLLRALKDCIAVTITCPQLEKKLVLRIRNTEEEINELGDNEDYEIPNDDRKSFQRLSKKLQVYKNALAEIHAFVTDFAPGIPMPPNVEDGADKWMTTQFTAGAPVGSTVRMAWLFDVFHRFWKKHQRGYLASDPKLEEMHQGFSKKGKQGVKKKADAKWQRFTALFADYVTSTIGWKGQPSPDEQAQLVDAFGNHLIDQKTTGATDSRTIGPIKDFLSTLMTNMAGKDGSCSPCTILRVLQENTNSRRKDGRFTRSPYTTLTLDAVEACYEILHGVIKRDHGAHGAKKNSRPRTRG